MSCESAPTRRVRWIAIGAIMLLMTMLIGWLTMMRSEAGQALRRHASSNTIYSMYRDRITGIDPISVGGYGSSGFAIAINIYEPLYQYHYLKRPYVLTPCLAADMPQVSDDGLTWMITLRDDVRFEDDACFDSGKGRTVTAADWIYSCKRIADPRNATAAWSLLAEHIVGLDDYRQAIKDDPTNQSLTDAPVEGLTALSPTQIRIRLTRPWPQLPMVMAEACLSVVAREAVEHYGDQFMRHPVGTGPYRLKQWITDVEIMLERSPSYRGETYPTEGEPGDRKADLLDDAGRKMPFVDELSFRFIPAAEPTWLMLMQGQLDMHGVPGGKQFDNVMTTGRQLQPDLVKHGLILTRFPAVFTRWIGFNMNDPIIGSSLKLRQAISLAIDREEFNEIFLNGRNDVPTSLIPPVLKEHDPDYIDSFTRFDPDEARRLIAKVEAERGEPIPPLRMVLGGGGGGVFRQVGQLITRWFDNVGLSIQIEYVSENEVAAAMRRSPASLFFDAGYGVRYPDVCDLFSHFYSGDGDNRYHYQNKAFDDLYRRVSTMTDSPQRTRLARQMQQLVMNDRPCVIFLSYNWMSVRYDWLENFKPHAFYGLHGMAKYLRVDTNLRVRRLVGKE
ncbi:hypothetical protein HED60_11260 [Planctomycetales bacterium ZRK34]|nr:hypothetical protein HED60_11260 [Planctomycetales bacterium ZRK34]